MYIEFALERDQQGYYSEFDLMVIKRDIQKWAKKHGIPFKTKSIKYTVRVVFEDDSLCNFFALSYTGPGKFRIVDPLNNLT